MRCFFILLFAFLNGCANYAPVPVVDRSSRLTASSTGSSASPKTVVPLGMYLVKKGDTLYSIALEHGQDYRDVAAWNQLDNANLIQVDQLLRVAPPEGDIQVAVARPVTASGPIEIKSENTVTDTLIHAPKGGKTVFSADALAHAQAAADADKPATNTTATVEPKAAEVPSAVEKPAVATASGWIWPTNGKILEPFSEGGNKGLDIAGKVGDPVLAAADGVVSYAGAGLRGYGNLVVLRHDATWLSVYAHNSKILVKEKQTVKRGQKIAEIGSSDAVSPRLHFEIRQQGKPIDPQKFLPAR